MLFITKELLSCGKVYSLACSKCSSVLCPSFLNNWTLPSNYSPIFSIKYYPYGRHRLLELEGERKKSSSFILLFYLLLLYYMFAESLLYSLPAMCDFSNFYQLISSQHSVIPTGSMKGCVMFPEYASYTISADFSCQHPLDPTCSCPSKQHSTIAQLIQQNISKTPGTLYLSPIQPIFQHRRLRSGHWYFKTRCASLTLVNSLGGPCVASSWWSRLCLSRMFKNIYLLIYVILI